jgi:leucyl aminopeptidase
MFFHSPSSKTRIDVEYKLSIEKVNKPVKNNTIFIDPNKPFTSTQAICKELKLAIKDKVASFDTSLLPPSLKIVFLTYLTKELYSFQKYKKEQNSKSKYYFVDKNIDKNEKESIVYTLQCANIARDMENEPANIMSPEMFCIRAKSMLQKTANIKVLNVKDMQKEGLNLVLAIGKSSTRPPRFLVAEMIKNKDNPTICIIGKTVVYDAGGLNLKIKSMTPEMKTDKTGGCVAISIMKYFTRFPCNCNLVVICPVVENLLSQEVVRPGDVIKAHNGKMVEITDTDAEGRLLLADALSYSAKYKPSYIIDFATLTGWADSVHPDLNAVCWTKDMSIAATVNQAGEEVGERVWFLPPWDEYIDYAKSNVANVTNHTDNIATGAYFPVMFMLNFIPEHLKSRYIHFDICHNWKNNLAKGNCVLLGIELIKRLAIKLNNLQN